MQVYGQSIFFFNYGANTIHLDKEKVLEPLDILMKKIKLDPYVPSCTIINLKVIIYLNVNAKATKQTEEYLYNVRQVEIS